MTHNNIIVKSRIKVVATYPKYLVHVLFFMSSGLIPSINSVFEFDLPARIQKD